MALDVGSIALAPALVSVLVALGGTLVSATLAKFGFRSLPRAPVSATPVKRIPTLSDRIDSLSATLSQSRSLIDEIAAEIELQSTTLERLRTEAEENQRLAAISKEEAEAVRKVVTAAFEQGQKQVDRKSRRSQWLFFLAGIVAAVPVGVLASFLYALIAK